jgi:hypothetical protein
MTQFPIIQLRSRQGAVLPIVAVCIIMFLGCAALAIDIGMLFDSRAEAQRAADSAALAAASALIDEDIRTLPTTIQRDSATLRAKALAGMNIVRGAAVEPDEVTVTFPAIDRVQATITRASIPPLFAGVFGIKSLQVTASASAMGYQPGGTSCLKPFGVPDRDPFSLSSIGQNIVVWQKSTHNDYPLVKHLIKEDGGNNVRDAITSQVCNSAYITVGDLLELQSGTASFAGQVEQGLDRIYNADKTLSYDPDNESTHPYDGFNREDWRTSSRIINLVTYNPATATQTTFVATGFLSIFLSEPMQNLAQGDRLQRGIVLPMRTVGRSGPCVEPNCCALCGWKLRLVK